METRRPARSRIAVVVLAAGASSRFEGAKQLAKIGGKTMLGTVLEAVPRTRVAETVVVVGHDAKRVAGAAEAGHARVVVNRDYARGMSSSIRAGVLSLEKNPDGVMFLLADQPFVTRSTLVRLVHAFEEGPARGSIVAVASGGFVSPPAIFSRRFFRELIALEGEAGAKSVIERHPRSLHKVRVRKRELSDIDTRKDLDDAERLLEP